VVATVPTDILYLAFGNCHGCLVGNLFDWFEKVWKSLC